MYEKLTAFLPKLQNDQFGLWHTDQENDGSAEHPIHLPFVNYSGVVCEFEEAVYSFVDEHEEIRDYERILKAAGLQWCAYSMKNANVDELDGKTVVALILGTIRAERFCDGVLLEFFKNGCIAKWLSRLQEIDQQQSMN